MAYPGSMPQSMYPTTPGTVPQPMSPYAPSEYSLSGVPANLMQASTPQTSPNQINQASQPGLPNLEQMGQGFAKGGSVNQGQGLASLGRGQDSMLVHMTPGEVQGLQGLAMKHGGSLTINPHTGLPEAGFLSNLLPTLAGIAAGTLTMNPFVGAAVAGGLGYAKHGNLMEGISAGFGAYSGSGLFSGLEAAGSAEATSEGAQLAASQAGQDAITQGFNPAFQRELIEEAGSKFATPQLDMFDPARLSNIAKGVPTSFDSAKNFFTATPMGEGASGLSNRTALMGLGATGLQAMGPSQANFVIPATEPDEEMARYKMSPNFKGYTAPLPDYYKPSYTNYARPGYAAGGVTDAQVDSTGVPTVYDPLTGKYKSISDQVSPTGVPLVYDPLTGKYSDGVNSSVAGLGNPYAVPDAGGGTPDGGNPHGGEGMGTGPGVGDGEYAAGGIARDNDPDTASLDAYSAALARLKKLNTKANMPSKYASPPASGIKGLGNIQPMAAGGQLGGYSDGGHLLKGPGDGMSDSIPASINQKQPAALADGEFVVPADVVSHLGNGSTDAGAKRLYSMMNKIRRARTGNPKQGKQINPNKFMPR